MKVLTYADQILERLLAERISPLRARFLLLLAQEPRQTSFAICDKLGCQRPFVSNSKYVQTELINNRTHYRLNALGESLVAKLFSKS